MMTREEQTSSDVPLPAKPYVGVRPFERDERAIFFGRDRDAVLLRDKVFSSRLTILYGGSGTGKSSLLRTLVIPFLDVQGARPLYCDAWRGEDPLGSLKAMLVKEAVKLGIPDADAGAPSLTDLVHLLLSARVRSVVLILDQFEELFTSGGERVDPLRKALGGLVRASGVNVHVVFSLREEHLAALEPFRSEVLNLFQSTYRLEPLNAKSAREAIEGPLQHFSASYEPKLVDELERDLQLEQKAIVQGQRAAQAWADLPMLQLVCDELWKEATRRKVTRLSLDLYREMGGRQGILAAYLGRIMPHRWNEQRLTARLLLHLAPGDGHKVSFSASHLASLTGFSPERVSAELERLTAARVLRNRQYGTGNVLYELWHDRFIHLLAPWRDAILRRDRRWRWTRNAAGILLMVGVAALGAYASKSRWDLSKNTEMVWNDDHRRPEQKFDHVASYLLWTRSGSSRFDTLREELEPRASQLPPDYGVSSSGLESVTLPAPSEDWPLTLHYSKDRKLDPYRFMQTWQELAREMHEREGIPVPLQLQLDERYDYSREQLLLTGPGIEPLSLKAPPAEQATFISTEGLAEPGQQLLEKFPEEWTIVQADPALRFVPRWSLPAWKASGTLASDSSGLPAHLLMEELRKNLDRMLTDEAVEAMLSEVEKFRPDTVAEVRRARQGQLTRDLQEVVRKGCSLKGLPSWLDLLANDPKGTPGASTTAAFHELRSAQAAAAGRLLGPHAKAPPRSRTGSPRGSTSMHPAYQAVLPGLSLEQPEIRVQLGQELVTVWSTERAELVSEALERMDALRVDNLRRFGIWMPGVSFTPAELEQGLPRDAVRIQLQTQTRCDAAPLHLGTYDSSLRLGQEDALERLSAVLGLKVQVLRVHFVTAEHVESVLNGMSPGPASWLRKHYSVTDLKRLLRAVISPSDEELQEIDEQWRTLEAGGAVAPVNVPPDKSILHPEWLLGSLVFWSKVHDPYSLQLLAEALRTTQHARLFGEPAAVSGNARVERLVEEGVEALERGRIAAAEAAFARAIKLDEGAAVSRFRARYPRMMERSLVQRLLSVCQPFRGPSQPSLKPAERAELEDFLAGKPDPSVTDETARRLGVCRLAAHPKSKARERRRLAEELEAQHGQALSWPADDAAWFCSERLKDFDPFSDDASILDDRLACLVRGFRQLEDEKAGGLVVDVLTFCESPGPRGWCWKRVIRALADAREDPRSLGSLALWLSYHTVEADLELALVLVERVKGRLRAASLAPEVRQGLLDWAELSRAIALKNLAGLGAGGDEAEAKAERVLLMLQGSPDPELSWPVAIELVGLRRRQQRLTEATAILQDAPTKHRDDPSVYSERLSVQLLGGAREGVAQVAQESLGLAREMEKAQEEVKLEQWLMPQKYLEPKLRDLQVKESEFLFLAAVGFLVTGEGAWESVAREFFDTGHMYVPYAALILHARMLGGATKEEARKVLDDLWRRAKRETWEARLREGDATAWREMLVGYALGWVHREELLAGLEDEERFARSALHNLPISRSEMLCEVYFYDALLAGAREDLDGMKVSLKKVVDLRQFDYFEVAIAQFLLKQERPSIGARTKDVRARTPRK